ncbi:MAG: hypothetical protein ACM3WU_12415 [Bacillota bacterium]
MGIQNTFVLRLIFVPIVIGICVSILLLIVQKKSNKNNSLNLSSYLTGYGICVAINIAVLVVTMGFLFLPCFIITFGPLVYFSFMINKKIVLDTKLRNPIINFSCKFIISLLIWFTAFFPFSLWGLKEIIDIPANMAKNQEIIQLKEGISSYETYADLTPFGLGFYKLQKEGDRYLWDITKPEDHIVDYDGVYMVFENHFNRKDDESWDNAWGNSNKGKDVLYDVYSYEGTFIIVTPLWEKPGVNYYWGFIYLCKDINKGVDLFEIGIPDPKVVEKFRELPGEKLSRKELAVKLGKAF